MKTLYPLLFVLLFVSSNAFSQSKKDTLTLTQKFDKIYRTSSSYQEYKVIRKTRFQDLKKQVSDSVSTLKKEISDKNKLIASQKDSVKNVKEVANILSADLNLTLTEKNSIQFLGISLHKSTYNLIVWSVIVCLLVSLFYFIYRFKNSNVVTTTAKRELQELEEEFATHKKKSLEKEQKLRRQLQDEINKQRGV